MSPDSIQLAGMILAIVIGVVALMLISQQAFPTFEYAEPRKLIGIQENVGQESGLFLWKARSIDVILQAFVLFASALGCLAILRAERW